MSAHTSPKNPPLVKLNDDGSYTRLIPDPRSLPIPDPESDTPVLSKDLTINDTTKAWVRIHIPKKTLISTETPLNKLPLIVYYHSGGFVMSSAATTIAHDLCNEVAANLPSVVVNVDYRLAPEHRLPAAYEDGVEALHWIKSTHDPWLTNFADFTNCYLMGTSAGGNLAYHAGLRVSQNVIDFEPLKIKGLILHCPFFGGVERTESEIRSVANWRPFALWICDTCWDLCLPVGASRDHEYSNPMMGCGLDGMGWIKDAGWRVMVIGRYGDLLIDRQMGFAKSLESKGVECKGFYGDGDHGIECYDKSKARELCGEIVKFVSSSCIICINVK